MTSKGHAHNHAEYLTAMKNGLLFYLSNIHQLQKDSTVTLFCTEYRPVQSVGWFYSFYCITQAHLIIALV